MRFWDHVAGLPPADQLALVTDLTLGCGHLTLAGRYHDGDAATVVVLGTLAAAHRALSAARAALEPAAAPAPDRHHHPALHETLPRRWADLLAATPPGAAGTRLRAAMAAAADGAKAALDDGEVDDIRDRLGQALAALGALRDTVAHAAA